MSSVLDPAKLKVVELRAELSNRGLDTKGNKAVLVKRLKDALEEELKTELPDTSIADTSTEDCNTSQTEEEPPAKDPGEVTKDEPDSECENPPLEEPKVETKPEESMDTTEEPQNESETVSPVVSEEKPEPVETAQPEPESTKAEENGEQKNIENDDPPCKKTRLDEEANSVEELAAENIEGNAAGDSERKEEDDKESSEETGQKRKRHTEGPKPRAKSPIKEDEPAIDANKVQLNWYDSDLHLQIDKESFLKAKPYHDGAFGYVWAGVRATHGAKTGKVCFEVKVTEELKWEDIIKQPERGNRDRDRKDKRRSDQKDRSKSESEDKKEQPKDTSENGTPEEKESEDREPSEQTKDDPEKTEEEGTVEAAEKTDAEVTPNEEKKDDKEQQETVESSEEKKEGDEEKKDDEKKEVEEEKKEVEEEKKEEQEEKKDEETTGEENTEEKMETEDSASKEEVKVPEVKIPTHLIRIGWSTISNGLQLGESKYSYGFESSGKFVTDKGFIDYGKTFTVGDVIGAFLEFTDESINIFYTINGEELSIATSVPTSELPDGEFALFPHILSKNYAFEVNFGEREEPFCTSPESLSAYEFVNKAEDKVMGPQRPETRSECEVIMMCGLPAAGKTHWVKQYLTENPDKKYTIIGNTELLEKMTVDGTPLKTSIQGSWPNVVDKLPRCLNKLVEVASLRRRNYVIDQTNEVHAVQRRRMRSFEGFKRRTVIVVCSDEEQARRQALHEAETEIPISSAALLEIKANLTLPRVGDWVEEVTYVELKEEDAKAMVAKYNKEGRDAGYGYNARRDHKNKGFGKWDNRRDNRGGYRHKPYHQRFDRGGHKHGDWKNPRWSHNDRRDNRDSHSSGSRDWRPPRGNGPRHQDRTRDDRHRSSGSRDNYRHGNQGRSWQNSSGGGGRNWNQNAWSGGSNWQQGGGGGGGGSGGYWNQGAWTPNQGSKWNQGYNQGGYGGGHNSGYGSYYGNYSNWNQNQSGSNGNGA